MQQNLDEFWPATLMAKSFSFCRDIVWIRANGFHQGNYSSMIQSSIAGSVLQPVSLFLVRHILHVGYYLRVFGISAMK